MALEKVTPLTCGATNSNRFFNGWVGVFFIVEAGAAGGSGSPPQDMRKKTKMIKQKWMIARDLNFFIKIKFDCQLNKDEHFCKMLIMKVLR